MCSPTSCFLLPAKMNRRLSTTSSNPSTTPSYDESPSRWDTICPRVQSHSNANMEGEMIPIMLSDNHGLSRHAGEGRTLWYRAVLSEFSTGSCLEGKHGIEMHPNWAENPAGFWFVSLLSVPCIDDPYSRLQSAHFSLSISLGTSTQSRPIETQRSSISISGRECSAVASARGINDNWPTRSPPLSILQYVELQQECQDGEPTLAMLSTRPCVL
jgi:hypothetical protein